MTGQAKSRQTISRISPLPVCDRCSMQYGEQRMPPAADGLCGPCRHAVGDEGRRAALAAYRSGKGS